MSKLWLANVLLAIHCAGCGSAAPQTESTSAAERLTRADLDRFLAVVRSHADSLIPEFTPAENQNELDYGRPADELVRECRRQFGKVFDLKRQGDVWAADKRWSQALGAAAITGAEFAGLVRRVSCAVMRVRLAARVDIGRLIANARAEASDLIATLNAIDELPMDERTRQDNFIRTQSALRLARMTALVEFAEMVKAVPSEDCALIRQYSAELKPLLPSSGSDELLAELQSLGAPQANEVVPAGYTAPAGAE